MGYSVQFIIHIQCVAADALATQHSGASAAQLLAKISLDTLYYLKGCLRGDWEIAP